MVDARGRFVSGRIEFSSYQGPLYRPVQRQPNAEPQRGPPTRPQTPKQDTKEELGKMRAAIYIFVLIVVGFIVFMGPLKGVFNIRDIFPGCSDGTKHDSCSETKPYYCFDGRLSENVETCGCPSGERAYEFHCIPIITCIDGTLHPECSDDKPFQCLNGDLILKASLCGCPDGLVKEGEHCRVASI